ncbi:MAG: YigZ family protein [Actinobacteria bacterium]|nr:YigZ family protein [Actinomycetota bacterium]
MPDSSFKTIGKLSTFEMKERGSRFIARALPVPAKKEAENFIHQIRKKHFDATHNCFAYRIGNGRNETTRFNDDGEPSGTAGRPILQAITTRNLTNVCIVVTRYFGGTKLGTGGLIRAYGGAASQVLETSDIRVEYFTTEIQISYDYEFSNFVMREIDKFQVNILKKEYDQNVKLFISIRESFAAKFVKQLTNQSSGKIKIILN